MEVSEVANRTVGLNLNAFPASQPRPAARGSSDRGAAGDPSTAVFIDEIYMGRRRLGFDVGSGVEGTAGRLMGRTSSSAPCMWSIAVPA